METEEEKVLPFFSQSLTSEELAQVASIEGEDFKEDLTRVRDTLPYPSRVSFRFSFLLSPIFHRIIPLALPSLLLHYCSLCNYYYPHEHYVGITPVL